MQSVNKILIGTSGWNYKHWRGSFYNDNIKQKNWLEYYSKKFSTVEINNSFYNLPEESTLKYWKETVPDSFLFSVKASRYITHMKKLKGAEEPLNRFLKRISVLENKLGPVLFQLPPRWHINRDRLTGFLDLLSQDFRYVFEFRDNSWWDESVYQLLHEYNAAFCIFDLNRRLSPKKITTDFVYVRLHGPEEAYQGKYDSQTLAGWVGSFSAYIKDKHKIYCYFDNDQNAFAVQNALQLQDMLA
jgi:uncharacterized protein YecE (DUF72 family)